MVSLHVCAGSLSVEADLDAREPVLPMVRDRRGWPVLHRMHVLQAPQGCDYERHVHSRAGDLAGQEAVGTYLGEGLLDWGLVAAVHNDGLELAEGLDGQDGAGVVF